MNDRKKTQARWAIEAYIDGGGEMPASKETIVDWVCEHCRIETPSLEVLEYDYIKTAIENELQRKSPYKGVKVREFVSAPTPVFDGNKKKIIYLWDLLTTCSRRHAQLAFNHMRSSIAQDIESLNNSIKFYNENNVRAKGRQLKLFQA